MYTFTWLSLVPLIFIIGVAQAENVFIQPPNKDLEQETSEIFSLGDRMNITLITDLDLVQILVQTDNTPDYHDSLHIYTEPRPREGGPNGPSNSHSTYKRSSFWVVDIEHLPGAQWSIKEVGHATAHLVLAGSDNSNEDNVAQTRKFIIVPPQPKSSPTTDLSPTPSSTMSQQSTSTFASSSPSPSPVANANHSNKAVIGGAVGGTLGGLVLLGALGFFLRKRLRKSSASQSPNVPATESGLREKRQSELAGNQPAVEIANTWPGQGLQDDHGPNKHRPQLSELA